MTLLVRVGAAACATLGAWLSCGALALTDEPFPERLGLLPPLWTLGAAAVVAIGLVVALRPAVARLLPLFFSAVLVLPWLPGPVPGAFLIWVRPVTWGVWMAIGLAMLAVVHRPAGRRASRPWLGDPQRAPLVVGAVAWGAYLAVAPQFSAIRPSGDEPHYLVITQSLLADRDLRIENNHKRGDYRAYYDGHLPPHYIRRGKDGQIYSHHPPGLPALLVPAFAVGGYPGATVFLTGLAGLGLALAWRLAWRLTGDSGAAWFGTLAVGLSPPVALHAFAVFPEVPASVIVLAGLWALFLPPHAPTRRWVFHGALVALLPWLHPRYAVMAGALAVALAIRLRGWPGRVRALGAFLAVPAVSAACWFGFYWWVYGRPDPSAPTGQLQLSLSSLPTGLSGLLFDQQFGFVANAPVALVAGFGLLWLLLGGDRTGDAGFGPSRRFLGLVLLGVIGSYLVVVGWWRMWWAGDNAPARFVVAVGLPLALPASAGWTALRARADRAVVAGLLALTVFTTLAMVGADGGRLAFNGRDGFARVLDWAGPLADLPRAAPSLFRHEPGRALAGVAVWGAALALLWLGLRVWDRGEQRSVGALALMTLSLGGAAIMAAVTVGWRLDHASGLRPNASRAAALRAYDAWIHRTGLSIGRAPAEPWPAPFGVRLFAPPDLVRRLDLASEGRQAPRPPVVLALGWLPAGTYRLREAWPDGLAPALEAAVSARGPAIDVRPQEWTGSGDTGGGSAWRFTLPVDAGGLVVRGQAGATVPSSGAVRLVPEALLPRDARAAAGRAEGGVRLGATRVFVIDEGAYVEPGGLWLRPGRTAELVVAPDARASAVGLFLRNAPVENRVEVQAGAWHLALELPPRGEREVTVPSPPGGRVVTVRMRADSGFRPAEVDTASRDERRLACWVEVRRAR